MQVPTATQTPAIAFVLNTLDRGGMERMTLTLAEQMLARGRYRPVLYALAEPGELAGHAERTGLPLHSRLLRGRFDLRAIRRLRERLAADRPAAVVVVNPGGDRMFYAAMARGRRLADAPAKGRAALVLWCHSFPRPGRRIIEPVNRLLARRFDAIAVLGPRAADAYVRIERMPAERMHLVPNGLPPDRLDRLADRSQRTATRARLGASADDIAVLCVANARPVKRLDILADAAAKLAGRHGRAGGAIRFWLAGAGPGDDALGRQLERLGLGPPGFVRLGARGDLERLWPAADVGVCCSDSEGLSVAMLEAMAAGVAFVSTVVGEHPEVIAPGENGLLIPCDSPAALAEAIGRFADDPSLRARLGKQAAATVRDRFTAERMADAFEAMLDQACQQAGER